LAAADDQTLEHMEKMTVAVVAQSAGTGSTTIADDGQITWVLD